jgi:hypothetical protein
VRRIALTSLVLVALGVVASFGYLAVTDRAAWPSWMPASLSAAVARLPLPDLSTPPAVSRVDLDAYEFQLVEREVEQAEGAVLTVRLVHKPSGRPVPDAVIFARRIDMAPDGMATMTAPLEPLPAAELGVYRFKTDLMMEGGWRLSLAAKVQGEAGTVQDRLVLKAVRR